MFASVVVNEFDIFCTSLFPNKADPPLRINADTMLTSTVADQPLQSISGWDSEVLDILRRMNQLKFPHGCPLDFAINTLDVILLPDPLGILVAEVSDHTISI